VSFGRENDEPEPVIVGSASPSPSAPYTEFYPSGSAIYPSPTITTADLIINYKSALQNDEKPDEERIKSLDATFEKYLGWHIKETQSIYARQKVYGAVIFTAVLLLVLSGIAFSVIQFSYAMRYRNFQSLSTDLEVRSGEIVLSTSLVGGFVFSCLTGIFLPFSSFCI